MKLIEDNSAVKIIASQALFTQLKNEFTLLPSKEAMLKALLNETLAPILVEKLLMFASQSSRDLFDPKLVEKLKARCTSDCLSLQQTIIQTKERIITKISQYYEDLINSKKISKRSPVGKYSPAP